eukprot:3052106-Prymnesium_polylepis.1
MGASGSTAVVAGAEHAHVPGVPLEHFEQRRTHAVEGVTSVRREQTGDVLQHHCTRAALPHITSRRAAAMSSGCTVRLSREYLLHGKRAGTNRSAAPRTPPQKTRTPPLQWPHCTTSPARNVVTIRPPVSQVHGSRNKKRRDDRSQAPSPALGDGRAVHRTTRRRAAGQAGSDL